MNKTNLLSLLGIFAGGVNHVSTVGIKIPSSTEEWMQFIFSLLLAAIGILAKGDEKGKEEKNGS